MMDEMQAIKSRAGFQRCGLGVSGKWVLCFGDTQQSVMTDVVVAHVNS